MTVLGPVLQAKNLYEGKTGYCVVPIWLIIPLHLFYLFFYAFSFNYDTGVLFYNYLVPVWVLTLVLAQVVRALPGTSVMVYTCDLVTLITLALCLSFQSANGQNFNAHNEVLGNTAVFSICFLYLRQIPTYLLDRFLLGLVTGSLLIELFLGLQELLTRAEPFPLHMTGSMNNSGVYSIYLVLQLPLALEYLKGIRLSNRWRNVIKTSICFTLVVVLFATISRTAIILLTIFWVFKLFSAKTIHIAKTPLLLFATLFIIGITALIALRPASILGRLLIWKISLAHSLDNLWFGIGYGNFQNYYPRWQMEYFANLPPENIHHVLHADESYVAFNEPIQLFVETGIVGILITSLLLYRFFKIRKEDRSDRIRSYQETLLLIIISTFSSYTLHVNVICLLLVIVLARLTPLAFRPVFTFRPRHVSLLITAVLVAIPLFRSIKLAYQASTWNAIRMAQVVDEKDRVAVFNKLYPSFKTNPNFLFDYGQSLFLAGDPRAVAILEESKRLFPSGAILSLTGEIHKSQGNINAAISIYKDLSNLMPYKFGYKQTLFNLYKQSGDTLNAIRTAQLITKMPVKKQSPLVDEIKLSMVEFLRGRH